MRLAHIVVAAHMTITYSFTSTMSRTSTMAVNAKPESSAACGHTNPREYRCAAESARNLDRSALAGMHLRASLGTRSAAAGLRANSVAVLGVKVELFLLDVQQR